jgi:hypothetical protein
MFINNNQIKIPHSSSLREWLLLVIVSLLPFSQLIASELNAEQYTISQGALKKELNKQQRENIIEANKLAALPDQLNGKATAKTRITMLNNSNPGSKESVNGVVNQSESNVSTHQDYYADFAIYGATSLLQEDYDGDGFYQTFSVIFDADIYSYTDNQFGEVYALLYISKNGGPWTHYFTTDDFLIEGDTDLDEYEVITTFLSGYSSDYYDVLIDLYQVGYSDIVATYSSDDSNALYALPLESADYDEPYIEVVEVHGGGSMSLLMLLLLSIYLIRINSKTL